MDNKLIGAGDLIEGSWQIYKNNRKPLMKVALWMFIPTLAVIIVSLFLRLLSVSEVTAIIVNALVSIPALLVQLWATIIFVLTIDAALEKREIDVRKFAEDAVRKFVPVLWVTVIVGLSVLGGFLLLIVPGIIFSVWFAFAYYETVLDGAKGRQALRKSRALVTGRFFPTLWRLAAPTVFWSVIVWLAMSTIFLVLGAISQPWKQIVSTEPGSTYAAAVLDIAANAIQALAAPLFTAVGVLLYRALKSARSESAQ